MQLPVIFGDIEKKQQWPYDHFKVMSIGYKSFPIEITKSIY